MGAFSVTSIVDAPPAEVWQRVTTPAGVNHELMPIVRMTWPPDVEALTPETVTPGVRLFRSWLLLFGVLPIDYDDLTVAEIEPGRRFLERSAMLSQRRWEHERTLEPVGEGATRVTDRLAHEPRLGLPSALFTPGFRLTFRWRHRRLRAWFGVPRAALLYDEDCGLCRTIAAGMLAWDRRGRLRPVAIGSAEGRALTPGMGEEERWGSVHLVDPGGTVRSAGAALARLFTLLPGAGPLGALLERAPSVAEWGYRAVADRRALLGKPIPPSLKRRADRMLTSHS